jgi:hypothetical protein
MEHNASIFRFRVIRVTVHQGYGGGDKYGSYSASVSGEGRKHAFTVINLALKMEARYFEVLVPTFQALQLAVN